MPSVQRVHDTFKNEDVKVLTVSIDEGGAKDVKPFMAEHKYTMRVLIDRKMVLFSKLGLLGTPGTFVVDRQGKIVAKSLGPVDFDSPAFRTFVQSLSAM